MEDNNQDTRAQRTNFLKLIMGSFLPKAKQIMFQLLCLCLFTPSLSLCNEKIGILFLHVGMNEHYRYASRQFGEVLWDFFPPVLDGADCYTVIHYADEIEAVTCGVEEGMPIDIFCNTYMGSDEVHSALAHGFLTGDGSFFRDCSRDIFPYLFLLLDSTTDPVTEKRIIGPHVHDGSGIGIPDSSETGAFRSMEKYMRYPGKKDWNREQELKWWYGNEAPGYDPDPEELTNIKDRLHELLPNTELVFRHGWEMYMKNIDVYGNYFRFSDSTETAIEELIQDEGVKKIVVLHTYPSFNNATQYGHEWYDEDGEGISAVPGKTFKQCVEDITDGAGPATRKKLNEYLANKPWDKHADHPWPLIERMVEDRDPTVRVGFAPAYGEFPAFEQSVLDMLEYTVEKYGIPQTASLKLILGHHGYAIASTREASVHPSLPSVDGRIAGRYRLGNQIRRRVLDPDDVITGGNAGEGGRAIRVAGSLIERRAGQCVVQVGLVPLLDQHR